MTEPAYTPTPSNNSTQTASAGFWTRLGMAIATLRHWFANVVFLLFLALVLMVALGSCQRLALPTNAALVINPQGIVVESAASVDPLQGLLSGSTTIVETEVGPIVQAIEYAATDDDIKTLFLRLDDLIWISTAHAQAIGQAVRNFQAAGKEVTSYGFFFEQSQYLLASYADAVYMHPLGQLLFEGVGSYSMYYKDLIDKLKVNVHTFRVGTYKSFVEPYERTDMSEPNRQATTALVTGLWQAISEQMAKNRQLHPTDINAYLNDIAAKVDAVNGDLARVALEANLVDELLSQDEVRIRMIDLVGQNDAGEVNGVDYRTYLQLAGVTRDSGGSPYVSVITAQGQIVMQGGMPNTIAADTLSNLIRQTKQDSNSKGLILRVDSPGGSAFASELIRQELELYQLSGRPVVVSMGNTAASGGYWIAATSDQIIAEPTTITGSIGIFGIMPTFENTLGELGISTDGVGVGPLSSTGSPLTGVNDTLASILQANVEQGYDQFINLVARGRDMTPKDVDAIAQGRVWLGSQALELGLVDKTGSLPDAISVATELAGVGSNDVHYVEAPVSLRQQLLRTLFESGVSAARLVGVASELGLSVPVPPAYAASAAWQPTLQYWMQTFATLSASLDDPMHRYVLCDQCRLPQGRR